MIQEHLTDFHYKKESIFNKFRKTFIYQFWTMEASTPKYQLFEKKEKSLD